MNKMHLPSLTPNKSGRAVTISIDLNATTNTYDHISMKNKIFKMEHFIYRKRRIDDTDGAYSVTEC